MRNKKVKFELSVAGLNDAIRAVEDYQNWLKDKCHMLLLNLAHIGYTIASAEFRTAVYDGTNDTDIVIEHRGESVIAIVAIGTSALFIEFGTGIVYPDNHPEAAENGMIRGEYGKGNGKKNTWVYSGDPGTNGVPMIKPDGSVVVFTHGNPANMPMYHAAKQIEIDLRRLVKEVFV